MYLTSKQIWEKIASNPAVWFWIRPVLGKEKNFDFLPTYSIFRQEGICARRGPKYEKAIIETPFLLECHRIINGKNHDIFLLLNILDYGRRYVVFPLTQIPPLEPNYLKKQCSSSSFLLTCSKYIGRSKMAMEYSAG